ncbi:hypothetical protein ES703_51386 [subsurface metagenome]
MAAPGPHKANTWGVEEGCGVYWGVIAAPDDSDLHPDVKCWQVADDCELAAGGQCRKGKLRGRF